MKVTKTRKGWPTRFDHPAPIRRSVSYERQLRGGGDSVSSESQRNPRKPRPRKGLDPLAQ